jgi:large subunit ribosomal protein L4
MHQALVRQMANARLGTRKTKTRSEVSGGGAKPWRQKGTGRARQGSRRAAQWVGGGKIHTPTPKDFSLRMPKKMRRAALRSALSVKAAESEIIVVDELSVESAKTTEISTTLKVLVGDSSALILVSERDDNLEKSVRNLDWAMTLNANYLNIRDLLKFDRIILPLGAVDVIQSYLG